MAKSTKEKAIPDEMSTKLEALFGKGTLKKADHDGIEEVKRWIPSGSYSLDCATRDSKGNGGFPMGGKATCLIGMESSGKSTNLYYAIGNAQKQGIECCLFDVENSLDKNYVQTLGVDLAKLYVVDTRALIKALGIRDRTVVSGEEWLELLVKVINSNLFGVIGFDSIAAMEPKVLVENGLSSAKMSYFAAMMARAYPAMNNALRNFDGALICVNQWRANPNDQWDPRTPVGGNAWKYLFSLIIDFKKLLLRDKDDKKVVLGDRVSGDILKSKVSEPRRTFSYVMKFGVGVVHQLEFKTAAIEYGIISKSGITYSFNGEKLCVGEPELDKLVFDNDEFYQQLKEAVLEYDRQQFSTDTPVPEGQQPDIQDVVEGPKEEGTDGDVPVPVEQEQNPEVQDL